MRAHQRLLVPLLLVLAAALRTTAAVMPDALHTLRLSSSSLVAEAQQRLAARAVVAPGHRSRAAAAAAYAAAIGQRNGTAQRHPRMHNILEVLQVSSVRTSLDAGIVVRPDRYKLHDGNGEWFNVTWNGIPDPQYDDWIAVVVPANANLSKTAPAKWKFAAESEMHITNGSGSLSFRLLNYGHDVAVAVMRNGFTTAVEVARSAPITVQQPNQPLQIHLALTKTPGEMLVQWNTRDMGSRPNVQWGTTPGGPYPYSAAAVESSTYSLTDMCGEPATSIGWIEPGTQHAALLANLEPGGRYYYTVGDEATGLWSAEYSFMAAPPRSAAVKILAVADMGQAEVDGSLEGSEMMPSLNTTARMADECPDCTLLLHNGDISYARGYGTQWVNFFNQLQPLAARMPYMVSPGNHERDWPGSGDVFGVLDSGGECGVPYERRMQMPLPGVDKQWYSFDYGPVHFLQYSTEHNFKPGSEQYAFMEADLASVDRSATPWVVVGGHRPPYVASTNAMWPDGDLLVAAMLRDALEPLFMQYKVDLTLHGHHHSYQRTCPVYQEQCRGYDEEGVAQAPVHLVIGHAGAGLSLNVGDPLPEWIEALALWWGYARLEVNATSLRVEVVSDETGGRMDGLELRKPPGWGARHMLHRVRQQLKADAS